MTLLMPLTEDGELAKAVLAPYLQQTHAFPIVHNLVIPHERDQKRDEVREGIVARLAKARYDEMVEHRRRRAGR